MSDQYQRTVQQSRNLANRMRNGTGAASLLHAYQAPTHEIDALQRFQKDFASYQKMRRQEERIRRQSQLEKKRIEILQRQSNRWQQVDNYNQKIKDREQYSVQNHLLGIKKTGNTGGLAYNPITLEYHKNPQGQKLKRFDEDAKVRGYVRAHNMDHKGNSKFNPLNGQARLGIQAVIPQQLGDRYQQKKYEYYDNLRLKVPASRESNRPYSYQSVHNYNNY